MFKKFLSSVFKDKIANNKRENEISQPSKDNEDIISTNAACFIKLFKRTGDTIRKQRQAKLTYDTFLSDSLIRCNINKNMGQASSTWSFTLAATAQWIEIIQPGDWVAIFLDNKDRINANSPSLRDVLNKDFRKGLKEIGQVDRIAKNYIINKDGKKTTVYQVNGRGFGKIFEDTTIFYNKWLTPDVLPEVLEAINRGIAGSPDVFVNKYIDLFLKPNIISKNSKISPIFNIDIPSKMFNYFAGNRKDYPDNQFLGIVNRKIEESIGHSNARTIPSSGAISLWSLIKKMSNEPFNEIFFEIIDGIPTLVMRPVQMSGGISKDYDNKEKKIIDIVSKGGGDWTFSAGDLYLAALSNHTIVDQKYIIHESLSYSFHEMYNYVMVYSNNNLSAEQQQYAAASYKMPILDRESIRQFGIRRIELLTDFGAVKLKTGKTDKTDWNIIVELAKKIAPYLFVKHRFQNGVITVEGVANFQLGKYIKVKSRKETAKGLDATKYFKVEGIQYDWQVLQPIQTMLTVTHGIGENGRFLDDDINWDEEGFASNIKR